MSGERTEGRDISNAPIVQNEGNAPAQAQPAEAVAEALARVQEVVINMKDGELRESLETAIDAIDTARETPALAAGDQLGPVADALEGALHELDQGKIANLVPVIEQAQTIVQSESLSP